MPITFTKIQAEILEAYKSTSRIAAQLAAGDVSRALEIMATQFERGVIALRQYCEENTAQRGSSVALSPPPISLAGRATVNEYGWLHIELNTLLPHCRVTSPQYLTDTITRLLDEYVCGGRTLPTELMNMRTVSERSQEELDTIGRAIEKLEDFSRRAHAASTFTYTPLMELYALKQTQ